MIPALVCGLIFGAAFLPVYGACFALFARRANASGGRQAAMLLAGTVFAMLVSAATILLPLWLADALPLDTQARTWVVAFFIGIAGNRLIAPQLRRASPRA
jgi:hypothetical protein